MAHHLRVESNLALSLLLALQVITSLSAIALLSRMAPALEVILQENDASILAVEDMLAALVATSLPDPLAAAPPRAQGPAAAPQDPAAAFHDALARARANVTEDAERPLLDALSATADAALSGDPTARADALAALRALTDINRASMRRADAHAQRLGTAGAWAAVALALAASLLGVAAMRRLNLRFIKPILDLHATARAFHGGDLLRRCPQPDPLRTPLELADISRALNDLLDAHLAHTCAPAPNPTASAHAATSAATAADALRPALLRLLDRLPAPTCLLDAEANVLAANGPALDLLCAEHAAPLRAAFAASPGEPAQHGGLSLSPEPIPNLPPPQQLWLCTLAYTL